MKSAQQILFPEVVLKLRFGFRVRTITLRPLTLRQLQAVKLQLADGLELCTGLRKKELHALSPSAISELSNRVNMINAWDPVALAKELEKEDPNSEPAKSLEDFAAELVAAGHDENGILDYSPEKFCFYLRQARRLRTRAELVQKKAFVEAAAHAVGTISKEGVKHANNFIKSLAAEIRKLDEVSP